MLLMTFGTTLVHGIFSFIRRSKYQCDKRNLKSSSNETNPAEQNMHQMKSIKRNNMCNVRITQQCGGIRVTTAIMEKQQHFPCADKPTRCNTSYEWSSLSINWLYMFRTIASPSSGASSHKLYNALQASLAVAWMGEWRLARRVLVEKLRKTMQFKVLGVDERIILEKI